ncbi:hypothetical protein SLS64_013913 [Diaporthe eres]|uniref:Dienelactone hydrolase domain-containing protein n=1 Tax=Diaporthe eres TaxID=83184 RepID=A0ABR1NPV0_DIAER
MSWTSWLVFKAALVLVPFSFRNSPPKRYPAVRKWIDDLRCGEGADQKVGVVGFCWGGYGATKLAHGEIASNGKPLIDAAYTAHPSELDVPKDIKGITLPYCMVIGDVDMAMSLEKVKQAAEILDAKEDVDTEVVIIPNAKHGFAVRASPDDKVEKEMADQAEDQMVKWFARHMD